MVSILNLYEIPEREKQNCIPRATSVPRSMRETSASMKDASLAKSPSPSLAIVGASESAALTLSQDKPRSVLNACDGTTGDGWRIAGRGLSASVQRRGVRIGRVGCSVLCAWWHNKCVC